jgi:hypothetical protein
LAEDKDEDKKNYLLKFVKKYFAVKCKLFKLDLEQSFTSRDINRLFQLEKEFKAFFSIVLEVKCHYLPRLEETWLRRTMKIRYRSKQMMDAEPHELEELMKIIKDPVPTDVLVLSKIIMIMTSNIYSYFLHYLSA